MKEGFKRRSSKRVNRVTTANGLSMASQVKEDGDVAVMTDCPSDVTDEQWQLIQKMLPKLSTCGRPPICRRRIVNAFLHSNRTGGQWG